MTYLRCAAFLGYSRRERLVDALDTSGAQWARSEGLGRTGRGTTRQLVPTTHDYVGPALGALRQIMASLCYKATASHFALPDPADLMPQVFPVLMQGSLTDPPYQDTHIDNRDGVPPLVTTVYYAQVVNTDGGEIVLCTVPEVSLTPREDDLVAFQGDSPHSVRELRAGLRLSVVCNFYKV